jgi:hypothetical protein
MYFEAGSPPYGAQIQYWLAESPDEDVEIAIQDPEGNEIQTFTGSKRAGLNTITWGLQVGGEALPLSPSEVRDSIAIEKRLAFVVDSMAAAGTDRDELDRVVEQLRESSGGGGFGGFGGGGGAVSTEWVERPAEGRPMGGGGGGRGEQGELSLQQQITQLVRGSGGGRGRRFGGGGGLFPSRSEPGGPAEPGTYTVVLKIGERTFTQPLSVERSASAPSS